MLEKLFQWKQKRKAEISDDTRLTPQEAFDFLCESKASKEEFFQALDEIENLRTEVDSLKSFVYGHLPDRQCKVVHDEQGQPVKIFTTQEIDGQQIVFHCIGEI